MKRNILHLTPESLSTQVANFVSNPFATCALCPIPPRLKQAKSLARRLRHGRLPHPGLLSELRRLLPAQSRLQGRPEEPAGRARRPHGPREAAAHRHTLRALRLAGRDSAQGHVHQSEDRPRGRSARLHQGPRASAQGLRDAAREAPGAPGTGEAFGSILFSFFFFLSIEKLFVDVSKFIGIDLLCILFPCAAMKTRFYWGNGGWIFLPRVRVIANFCASPSNSWTRGRKILWYWITRADMYYIFIRYENGVQWDYTWGDYILSLGIQILRTNGIALFYYFHRMILNEVKMVNKYCFREWYFIINSLNPRWREWSILYI